MPDAAQRATGMAIGCRSSSVRCARDGRSSATSSISASASPRATRRVGAFGYEGRVDYTAIGSVVNLAARLSNEAGPGEVLIDRRTRAALDDAANVESLGPIALKGFTQPVPVFRLTPSS